MPELACLLPISQSAELKSQLDSANIQYTYFGSEGFDGVAVGAIIIDLSTVVISSLAGVLAAKLASRKQLILKVDGIEVHANSLEEIQRALAMAQRQADEGK